LALAIGDDHLDDLSASSDKIGQKPGLFVRHRPDVRFGRLDEMGDHRRVDRIGLGPFAERLGESAHLRQIDHDDRQARRRKTRRNHRLTAAGRLDRDRLWRERRERGDQPAQTVRVPFDGERLPSRTHRHVQPILRYVDADDDGVHPAPSSRNRASLAAQATVRV
jgi:hypothetical protein